MSKFCYKCGSQVEEDDVFCGSCGASFNNRVTNGNNQQQNDSFNQQFSQAPIIGKREIVTAILLSIVTLGIYGIYWMIKMTDESNTVTNDFSTSGGKAFLFSILTCGIYSYYWNYKMGQKMYNAGRTHGKDINDNSTLYLILSIFGLSIINYCLIQSDLNKFAE